MESQPIASNTNVMIDEQTGVKIEDIPELRDNPRFVLSNSQEFQRPTTPPPQATPERTVQFSQPVTPPTQRRPNRKRTAEVNAFLEDIQHEQVDKAAYERLKKKEADELKQKIGLIAQINGYLNEEKFPGIKARANLKKVKYTEDDDIKTLTAAKETLERCIGTSSADNVASDYFGWLLTGIEMINRNGVLGLDTTGLAAQKTKILPEFKREIDELVIKYQWLFYQPPELRFATKFLRLLWTVNYMNKHGIQATTDADYSEVDPDVEAQFSDL